MIPTSRQTANAYSAGLASRFCGIRANKSNGRVKQNNDRSRARRGRGLAAATARRESESQDVSGND